MEKEPLSIMTVKILLAVIIFTGMGTIIVGGGYIIGEYSKNKASNQIVKPVNQETENYYNLLEKKCNGNNCCLSSFKTMRDNNYKEAGKDYKCPNGFKLGGLRCISSLKWCEPIKECVDEQNNHRKIGEIWLEDSTMFMECNEFGSVSSNYILSCGNEKLIISNSLSFDENSIYRNTPATPFFIGTDGSLKYTWIIDGNKYTESSGGPTGVFASCENEKVTILHFGGMDKAYYSKTFFDGNYKTRINCLDSDGEKDNPENFTISKVESGEVIGESGLLENGKEICQEIKERYQELKETTINISNWQTYRNEEFGFEMKLPSDWKAYSEYDGSIIASSAKEFPDNPLILTGTPPDLNFQIEIIQNMNLKDYQNNFFADVEAVEELQTEVKKIGLKLYRGNDVFFLIQINNNLLKIFSNKNYLFNDQIFSSIKFIDNNQPDTTNWQTYQNEELGFEVKYPEEWIVWKQMSKIHLDIIAFALKNDEIISPTNSRDPIFTIDYFSKKAWEEVQFLDEKYNIEKIKENNEGNVIAYKIYKDGYSEIINQILSTFKFIEN